MKEGPFVSSHDVDGVEVNKHEKDWTKDDTKKVQCGLKEKTIITTTLGLDEFFHFFTAILQRKCVTYYKLPMKGLLM